MSEHTTTTTTPDQVRCETCLGMGYKGRQRPSGWKIETCRACGGTGSRAASERQRPRAAQGGAR
jgi:DnaJ-class molecular chaperone